MNGGVSSCSFVDLVRLRSRFVERVLLASAALACAQCEPSVTIAVTTLADGGEGSLRRAISSANASSNAEVRIEIPPGTYDLTRCGTPDDSNARGDLDFTRTASLTIAAVSGNVVIRQTCPGERVIDVLGTGRLTLVGVQVTGGSLVASSATEDASGGGVRAAGDVTLQNTIIRGNSVRGAAGSAAPVDGTSTPGGTARGGGLYVGGALSTDYGTVITLNSATGGSGAPAAGDNVIPAAGGRAEGGGAFVVGAVALTGSELSRNTVTGGAGGSGVVPAAGGLARGGGLSQAETSTAPADLQSLTVSDNAAQGGESGGVAGAATLGDAGAAGAAEGGGIAASGAVFISFTTAMRNRALGGSTGIGQQPFVGGTGRANGPAGAAFGGAVAARRTVTAQNGLFELNVAVSGDTFFFCATPGCFGGPASSALGGAVYTPEAIALSQVRFADNSVSRGSGLGSADVVASGGAVASSSFSDAGGVYVGNSARAPEGNSLGAGTGGAISANEVELSATRLESNNATGSGGAVSALTFSALGMTAASNRAGGSGGGAVYVVGDALVDRSTVRHNSVESRLSSPGVALVGGGGISAGGALTISESWVANNTGRALVIFSNPRIGTFIMPARFMGGGVRASRIVARTTTFSANQTVASTITANMPLPVSPGVSGGAAIGVDDTAELINVTLADNHALPEPTFVNTSYGAPPQGSAILAGSISFEHVTVVDNQGAAAIQATSLTAQRSVAVAAAGTRVCGAAVASGASSYNWFSDASCALAGATNQQQSAAFLLGSLAQTVSSRPPVRAPLAGSVLIDAVPAASCPTVDDANGTPRPQGPACDVGAVEVPL